MEETLHKTSFIKNLDKQVFSLTFNLPIDSNVNIKTILNAHAYLYDEKIDCGNSKAIFTARIGLKVLYIDTDGISNTITDTQSLSENFSDTSISADSYINILNHNITTNVISSDGILKISCNISISPVMYLNLPISNNGNMAQSTINKENEITYNSISNTLNTSFNYTCSFETKETLNKILYHNSYFTPIETISKDGCIYVEGKLHSRLLYEVNENDEIITKELFDTFNIATEIPVSEIKANTLLDLNFSVDKSKEEITTETDDEDLIISIQNVIKISGVAFTETKINIIDDMFSCENELNLTYVEREFVKQIVCEQISEKVFGEITLSSKEPAIENVVSNLNICPELTNQYIKNDTLHFEGVISSHLNYIDENKDYQHKHLEFPFVLNTKLEMVSVENIHCDIHVLDCKIKVKRGTIIEIEYLIQINVHHHLKEKKTLIDSISVGNPIDFSGYDFQIYLAKPNETIWELCKRIKISPDKLNEINKNLPPIMNGGEKIIIKR